MFISAELLHILLTIFVVIKLLLNHFWIIYAKVLAFSCFRKTYTIKKANSNW